MNNRAVAPPLSDELATSRYLDRQRDIERKAQVVANMLIKRWQELLGPTEYNIGKDLFWLAQEWTVEELDSAMRITARKMGTPGVDCFSEDKVKYFHGVLKNVRKRQGSV